MSPLGAPLGGRANFFSGTVGALSAVVAPVYRLGAVLCYTVHCTLYAHCAMCCVLAAQCTVHIAQCRVHKAMCAVQSVPHTVLQRRPNELGPKSPKTSLGPPSNSNLHHSHSGAPGNDNELLIQRASGSPFGHCGRPACCVAELGGGAQVASWPARRATVGPSNEVDVCICGNGRAAGG